MSFQYLKSARKIICIGRNYAAHIKELNNAVPKNPFFFLKPTSSIITPLQPGQSHKPLPNSATFNGLEEDGTNPSPIYIPQNVQVHHEIELALIMKSNVSNVNPTNFSIRDLLNSIQGVALALDLTGRNVQTDAKKAGLPWTIAKGYDTFCPMSEMVLLDDLPQGVSADGFQDSFQLKCFVNDQLRQDGTSDLMLNPMDKMVSTISETMTLEPNDIVLTGTPAGVGEIKPGDKIQGQLFYKGTKIIDMTFLCETKPGQYIYQSSV